jgi:hypothetical protein
MIEPRLFLCSGATLARNDPLEAGRKQILLDSIGANPNVNIRFENVAKIFERHLSPRLTDLLEIAAYVYAADCSTRRGTQWTDEDSTEPWGRDFAFMIAVREPTFWGSPEITTQLTEVLGFLSNDRYSFRFVQLEHDRPDQQQYFDFGDQDDWPFHRPERVLMLSGGLDSLAGAVETAREGGRLVLVSHRPVSTLSSRQRRLVGALQREFPGRLIHVPVWINKNERLGREPTQRARSFLYAALGTVIAESVQAGGVRFFENGIVSLNLPVADEAIRARASRTTHPIALYLLQSLCRAVTKRDFVIDNPYLFKTKTDVVESLAAHGVPHLIPYTCSCAHLMFKSKTQLHCGRCSQCIDRRFAIIAAGQMVHDPDTDYETDVFLGPRKDGPEKSMAVDYVRHGIELDLLSELELATRFNAELSRAVRFEAKRSEVAEKIIRLHRRHGEAVVRVLKAEIAEHSEDLIKGTLDDSSLLGLIVGKRHLEQQDVVANAPHEGRSGAARSREAITTDAETLREVVSSVFAGFERKKRRAPKKQKLQKRDAVIFGAILLDLKGIKYCSFLQEHQIRPKWSDSDSAHENYVKSYVAGNPRRKKVQDEKTRAKSRIDRYNDEELAKAFSAYLPERLNELREQLSVRPTRAARRKLPF